MPSFAGAFTALGELAYGGAQVSASVIDLDSDERVLSIDDRIVLPTASVGKILLLIEVSARLSEQAAPALEVLDKTPKDAVGDSGLWRHLQARSLPLADVATLVGATSDNLATNVLLREVGLDAVRERTEALGLMRTALLDLVRDTRGPDDAPQLSVGSTAELAWLFASLARGQVVDALTSSRVLGWLSLNTDLSMVASAFGVDPLSHRGVDHGLQLVNKTGTDSGVRSEVGVLRGPRRGIAYAVSVQFSDRSIASRLRVLEALRAVGFDLLEYVH
ncbi:serine hydrolase [Protaetiibacter intestinalis]|uniref:Serine hydrolase n=1 Tax=Protaetiibacter intestinalis TaxID=2419774 RepID=A0A387BCQ8_9MICO|nr:serine hydrolase [Protaetiibacter intestinalis]